MSMLMDLGTGLWAGNREETQEETREVREEGSHNQLAYL